MVTVEFVANANRARSAPETVPGVTLMIARLIGEGPLTTCVSRAGQTVLLPRPAMPRVGDEVFIVLPPQEPSAESLKNQTTCADQREGQESGEAIGNREALPWMPAEFCLARPADRHATVIQTQIGYVPLPMGDRNGDPFIRIPLETKGLGLSAICLPCRAIRDYFFVPDRRSPWDRRRTLYQELVVSPQSSFAELHAVFRLRRLELQRQHKHAEILSLERVYNVLAIPPLRTAYDALLIDPDRPVEFPGAGYGALIAGGTRRADTFFVERILAFRPDCSFRKFAVPFRQIEFCVGYAVIHDSRQKREIFLDPHMLSLDWNPTWNQWRQYIGRKIQISAECIRTGRYRKASGKWNYADWYTALPSRTNVLCPQELLRDIAQAQKTHHRFGRFQRDIEVLREKVQHKPLEIAEVQRLCWDRGLPGDFDPRLIVWQPEFDEFFYERLKQYASSTYLWREEFIFELEHTIIVEIPQAGRASYAFKKPAGLDRWLACYVRTSRAGIRTNRGNVAETLGFIGRVVHGKQPENWWKELLQRTGEALLA